MRILIDADGCPVVDETLEVGKINNIEVIIFCDTSHIFNYSDVKVITVSKGPDSVDFKIVNEILENDIVVTQDYGLAAMVLSRKGHPITQNGLIINDSNIDSLLQSRYISKKERSKGNHLKGPSKRKNESNIKFKNSLIKLISEFS